MPQYGYPYQGIPSPGQQYSQNQAQQQLNQWTNIQDMGLRLQALLSQIAGQQNQNAAYGINNGNTLAQALQSFAATNYGVGQDVAALPLQLLRAQGDLASNQVSNARYLRNLDLDVAQADANRQERDARYVQGLDDQMWGLASARGQQRRESGLSQLKNTYGYR